MNATTIATFVSTASVSLERIEAAVYRADAVFQAHVVPKVIAIATWCAVQFCRAFFAAAVLSYVAGRLTAEWFWATVDRYATPDFAPDYVEEMPALSGFVPFGLLCAAPERVLVTPYVEIRGLLPSVADGRVQLEAKAVCRRLDAMRKANRADAYVFPTGATLVTPAPRSAAEVRVAVATARLNMSIRELRQVARESGMKGYSKMSKTMLLSLLAV